MNKRIAAILAFGLAIPSIAYAAQAAMSCCPGACCLSWCPFCP